MLKHIEELILNPIFDKKYIKTEMMLIILSLIKIPQNVNNLSKTSLITFISSCIVISNSNFILSFIM
jgi:hypothetical protein